MEGRSLLRGRPDRHQTGAGRDLRVIMASTWEREGRYHYQVVVGMMDYKRASKKQFCIASRLVCISLNITCKLFIENL